MKTIAIRIIAVVVLIVLALTLVVQHQSRAQKEKAEREAARQQEEQERSAALTRQRQRTQIPLTRQRIVFNPAEPAPGRQNMFLNEKGEPAESERIVVNIKIKGGGAGIFAVVRISVVGDPENLLRGLNEKNELLIEATAASLGAKSMDEVETVGFKRGLKSELQAQFNQILGGEHVKEVIITDFVVQ